MIRSFRNQQSEDVFNGVKNKRAAKVLPLALWGVAARKLDQVNRVVGLDELNVPTGNRLKPLRGDRAGQHSIRINDQYRICFRWADDGAHELKSRTITRSVAESPLSTWPSWPEGRMRKLPTHRPPTHPGEMLMEEFLKPLAISQTEFAERIGVSYPRLNELIHGKRGVTPDTALRLAHVLGMSADFWLGLQQDWDLWHAERSPKAKLIKKLQPITAA